nr:HNH endonuclease family protein [Gordonia hydrophobica]
MRQAMGSTWWRMRVLRIRVHRPGRVRLTGRQWMWLVVFAATTVLVAVGVGLPSPPRTVDWTAVATARSRLARLTVLDRRPAHDVGYDRDAFGPAWTDAADVRGGGNSCDTRNDILSRDLAVTARIAIESCPRAVAAGTFVSPYTGRPISFRRGRGSAAVQIDHVVPLSYAWDLGAAQWPRPRRWAFANDPSNLLAVDADSNQNKSDSEPARWMPRLRGFHCQYAIAFIRVLDGYRLPVDAPSRSVLATALATC